MINLGFSRGYLDARGRTRERADYISSTCGDTRMDGTGRTSRVSLRSDEKHIEEHTNLQKQSNNIPCYQSMTQIVLNIDNVSAAKAIRALVKNMIGVRIVSDSKATPKDSEEDLTARICNSLRQVKMIQEGKLPRRSVEDMLNEL